MFVSELTFSHVFFPFLATSLRAFVTFATDRFSGFRSAPDALITNNFLQVTYSIEVTTSADLELLQKTLSLLEKSIPLSLTGHNGGDIVGSKHKPYQIDGRPITDRDVSIKGDTVAEWIDRQKERIISSIEKKLDKSHLTGENNWLVILVNDYTPFSSDLWEAYISLFDEVFLIYYAKLKKLKARRLSFLGYNLPLVAKTYVI
ncbi:MAG: hypothetical protein IPG59_20120 [Candidatus Melainabacteria bacterium]|nr:MAG: hypothetical protein IPG59_20120 [Candidatus Melainabacteria bacterium]